MTKNKGEMGREELLTDLRQGFNGYRMTYQGFSQIAEIIESHFTEPNIFDNDFFHHMKSLAKPPDPDVKKIINEIDYYLLLYRDTDGVILKKDLIKHIRTILTRKGEKENK